MKQKGLNKRTISILAVLLAISIALITMVAIGDDSDGVDYIIQYETSNFWNTVYEQLDATSDALPSEELLESRKITEHSNSFSTGSEDLDLWLADTLSGKILIDTIVEKDGYEHYVVVDLAENELSVVSINDFDEMKTTKVAITKPNPQHAKVETFLLDDLEHLGNSGDIRPQGDTFSIPAPQEGRDEKGADKSFNTPPKPSSKEESTLSLDDFQLEEDFLQEMQSMATSFVLHLPSKVEFLPILAEGDVSESSTEKEEQVDTVVTPKEKEQNETTEESQSSVQEQSVSETEKVESVPSETEKEQSEVPISSVPESSQAETSKMPDVSSTPEASTEESKSSEIIPPKIVPQEESPLPQEEESEDIPLGASSQEETEQVDEKKEEKFEITLFSDTDLENPTEPILMSVPAHGVGIVTLKISPNFLTFPSGGLPMEQGTIRIYSKDSTSNENYLTTSLDNHVKKYAIEENTKLTISATTTNPASHITVELLNETPVELGQIDFSHIAQVDFLNPETGTNHELIANHTKLSGGGYLPHAIIGGDTITASAGVSLRGYSESVGGAGLYSNKGIELTDSQGDFSGESYGILLNTDDGNDLADYIKISGGQVKTAVAPSRSNNDFDHVAGIETAGRLEILGNAKVNIEVDAEVVVPAPTTHRHPERNSPTFREEDEILPQVKSYGVYLGDLYVTGGDWNHHESENKSTIIVNGGDIGAFVDRNFCITQGARGDFSGNWVGLFSSTGTGKILDGATIVKTRAMGRDTAGNPIGTGIFTGTSFDIGKDKSTVTIGDQDHYYGVAPKVYVTGSQIGIFVGKQKHFSCEDNSYLEVRGGVEEQFVGDRKNYPALVENTFGMLTDEASYIKFSYHTQVKVYGGDMGLYFYGGNFKDKCGVYYSSQLEAFGGRIGARTMMEFYCQYGSYVTAKGNEIGFNQLPYDQGPVKGADFFIGEQDPYPASLHSFSVLEAFAKQTWGVYLLNGHTIYGKDSYMYGESDSFNAGIAVNLPHWTCTAEAPAYIVGRNLMYGIVTSKTTEFQGAPEVAVLMRPLLDAPSAPENSVFIQNIMEAEQGQGALSSVNASTYTRLQDALFYGAIRGRGTGFVDYNWHTQPPQEGNYEYQQGWPSNNISDYTMDSNFPTTLYPHDDTKFEFSRVVERRSNVDLIDYQKGIGLRPLKTEENVDIIADGVITNGDPFIIPGWTDMDMPLDEHYHSAYPVNARVRMILNKADMSANPEANIYFHFMHIKDDGTKVPLEVEEYEGFKFDIQYKAPGETQFVTFQKGSDGLNIYRGPHVGGKQDFPQIMLPLREGEYILTDITDRKGKFREPKPLHFTMKFEEVDDGIQSEYKLYQPKFTFLDVEEGQEDFVVIGEISQVPDYANRFEKTLFPVGNPNIDMYPAFYGLHLEWNYRTYKDSMTVEIVDKNDSDRHLGGQVKVEVFRDRALTMPVETIYLTVPKNDPDNLPTFDLDRYLYYKFTQMGENDQVPVADPIEFQPPESHLLLEWSSNMATWLEGSLDDYNYTKIDRHSGKVTIYNRLPKYEGELHLVSAEDPSRYLNGGSFELIEKNSDTHATTTTQLNLLNPAGVVTLKNLKPRHVYTLTQKTTEPQFFMREKSYKFTVQLTQKANGEIEEWALVQVPNNVEPNDGWVAGNTHFVTISNEPVPPHVPDPKPDSGSLRVKIVADKVWEPHGNPNFIVKVESLSTTAVPYCVFQSIVVEGTDNTEILQDDTILYTETGVLNKLTVGDYKVTILPLQRFEITSAKELTVTITKDQITEISFDAHCHDLRYLSEVVTLRRRFTYDTSAGN